NIIFAGTTVLYGRGKAVVTDTGMNTEFGSIAQEMMAVKSEKTPLEKRTEEIGKLLGIAALVICFLVAGFSVIREFWTGGKVDIPFIIKMIMFAVALAVAAVPEALAAIVTGALAIGMRQMAKHNALIRKMPAVETLGSTTVICSDKTGTLTRGEMTIRRVFAGGKSYEISGAGYAPVGQIKGIEPVNVCEGTALNLFFWSGVLCNDSDLWENEEKKWLIKGDPTEASLVVAAAKIGVDVKSIRRQNPRVDELPFSSERKRMTTVHLREDNTRMACMKGAPEVLLDKCAYIMDENGMRQLTGSDREQIMTINEEMAADALRVLAVACRELDNDCQCTEDTVENDMIFLGIVGMMDPPREEVIDATMRCKRVGIKPIMITGDHQLTAKAVAKEIGFYEDGDMVLTGQELEKMPDEEFEKIVDKVTVYARVSPMDKLKIVKAWKKKGEVVAMTGDGVNDAPALKHADIGIAMGIAGTEVTKEAADMVLTDDNFATIVKAIELGRWIYDNIKKYLTFLVRCNITEVIVIGGIVLISGVSYLPIVAAAILYINLATDGLPALALGISPPDPDIMERPPRDPREGVFTFDVKVFILLALVVEIPFFFFLFYHDMTDLNYARTEMFFLFIIIEMIIALNFRSMKFSVFKVPPHKWLWLAIIWEFLLVSVLIQFPSVRNAFEINLPSLPMIGTILGFGAVVFFLMEVIKSLLKKRSEEKVST
ncbi:MAG TPA: cation-translocating P-type ATPase, partial [Syntrophorhabdaceae bacterium]|nr:cation-translocating P-type ATPase [Syntrophorhabdaceae bacterium]